METIKTVSGQNIFDIALMTYGDVSAVVQLLEDNPQININQEIKSGTILKYTKTQNAFVDFINKKEITIATDDQSNDTGRAFGSAFDNSFN
jgi:hypothetical protein